MRLPVILACLILAACASPDPPGSDAGVDDAGAQADARNDAAPCELVSPYSSSNAACDACAEARCCVEVNDCLLATSCNDDYVNCILACALDPDAGQDPCLADCATQFPAGKAAYDTAIGCVDAACAVECQ